MIKSNDMKGKALIAEIEREEIIKGGFENREGTFRPGDTIAVTYKVIEKKTDQKTGKEKQIIRSQVFQGTCIAIRRPKLMGAQFSVMRTSPHMSQKVEKSFALYSPKIVKIDVISTRLSRKAKLYRLRTLHGKAARIKEVRR